MAPTTRRARAQLAWTAGVVASSGVVSSPLSPPSPVAPVAPVARPRPLWIFGYGSLLFRPGFPFEEQRPAVVRGYRRRLDQGSPDHRGTPTRLGRVATLLHDPESSSGGAVFRVADHHAEEVLTALDHREKGGYARLELEAALLDGGANVLATTWIATPDNPYHLGPADLPQMVTQILAATGPSGTNIEYVIKLDETLRALGIDDPHVADIARALALPPRGG